MGREREISHRLTYAYGKRGNLRQLHTGKDTLLITIELTKKGGVLCNSTWGRFTMTVYTHRRGQEFNWSDFVYSIFIVYIFMSNLVYLV